MSERTQKGIEHGFTAIDRPGPAATEEFRLQVDALALSSFGQNVKGTAGLVYAWLPGVVQIGTQWQEVAGGSIALPPNSTKYLERSTTAATLAAFVVRVVDALATDGSQWVPMAKVITGSTGITSVVDLRPSYGVGVQGPKGDTGAQGLTGPPGTVSNNSGMAVGVDPGGSEVLRVGGDAKVKGSMFFESSTERQIRAYGASVSWGMYLGATGCGLYDWQNARNILGYVPGTNVRTCDGVLQVVGTTQTLKLSPNDVEFANNGWSNITQRTVGGSIALKCSAAAAGDTTVVVASAAAVTLYLPHRAAQYTVATLPAGSNGLEAYATNGRKPGEGAGAGTGCLVVYSGGQWRRLSDETPVQA